MGISTVSSRPHSPRRSAERPWHRICSALSHSGDDRRAAARSGGAVSESEDRDMRMKDIKDLNDLKEMNTNDVVDVLDELRAIATKRGTELLAQGRAGARRAMGAREQGAVGSAFFVGVLLGAAVGAFVA